MKNIAVSVSDKACAAARTSAVAECDLISVAVQAHIENLVRTEMASENLALINRIRRQARARDRAAKEEAAAQEALSNFFQQNSASVFAALRSFFEKHAETVQQ